MKQLILGNWKMHKTIGDIQQFCSTFNNLLKKNKQLPSSELIIGIAPTYIGIIPFASSNNTLTQVMAQNVSTESKGAFTSEIASEMLKELNISMVLVGHSEVRQNLNDSDKKINKKVLKLLKENMKPVLCIGETLEQFESNKTKEVLEKQLTIDLTGVDPTSVDNLIIAYEPIWAIGTGKTATTAIIHKTLSDIKKILKTILGDDSNKVAILYGGSVNENNATEILKIENVDGVLVGGASLDPEKFYQIIKASPKYSK